MRNQLAVNQHPLEFNVTYSSHGNSTVLHLRMAEPSDRLVASAFGEAERVPHLSHFRRVGALEDFRLADAGIQSGAAAGRLLSDWCKGGSASDQGRNDCHGDLHGEYGLRCYVV